MSAIFKKIVVTLVAIVAAGLVACTNGDSPAQTNWVEEAAKSGFSDPVLVEKGEEREVIMVSAGTCRLRLVVDVEASRLYATIPGAPLGEDESFLGDPSLALLKSDERFASCFSSEEEKQG